MRCEVCGKKFKDGEGVIPIHVYVVNERRGDFVGEQSNGRYLHAHHVGALLS